MATLKPKIQIDLGLNKIGVDAGLKGVRADLQGAEKAAQGATKQAGLLRRALANIGSTAAGFVVANAFQRAVGFVKSQIGGLVGAASDMNETVSKTRQIFGDSADAIIKWGQTSADSVGLSTEAALDAASTFGGMAKAAGKTGDQVVDFSKNMVQASADLGSFFNFDPAQVLDDIRSGLAGESEPLRKYNIFLNETAVAQEAMAETGKKSVQELTEGDKIAARYTLILRGMGDAQGDFARTNTGLANGTRILHANIANLRATLGQKLLPIVNRIVQAANRWFKQFALLRQKGLSPFTAAFRALHRVLLTFLSPAAAGALTRWLKGIGLIVRDGIRFVGDVIHGRWRQAWDELGRIVEIAKSRLVPLLSGIWKLVQSAFDAIPWGKLVRDVQSGLVSIWSGIDWGTVGSTIWTGVQTAFAFGKDAASWLLGKGQELIGYLWALDWSEIGKTVWDGITAAISAAVDLATAAAETLAGYGMDLLKGLWSLDWNAIGTDVWNGVWTALQYAKSLGPIALDVVVGLAGDLAQIANDFAGWLAKQLGWTGEKTIGLPKVTINADANIDLSTGQDKGGGLGDFLSGAWHFATDLPSKVMSALGAMQGWGQAVGDFIHGLINMIVGALVDGLTNLSKDDISKIGKALLAVATAVVATQDIALIPVLFAGAFVEGVIQGLVGDYAADLDKAMGGWVTDHIIKPVKDALGIASPSTVFAGIAGDLVAGLISGISFNDVFNYFWSIGRAITGGLVSGIASLWADFVAQIDALIAKAQSVKSALKVSSPSGFMRDVFANYMAGAVMGIHKGMPGFARAVNGVTATAMGGSPGGRIGMPSIAGVAAGGGRGANGGPPVTIHVHPSAGMDEELLAQKVAKHINRRVLRVRAGAA